MAIPRERGPAPPPVPRERGPAPPGGERPEPAPPPKPAPPTLEPVIAQPYVPPVNAKPVDWAWKKGATLPDGRPDPTAADKTKPTVLQTPDGELYYTPYHKTMWGELGWRTQSEYRESQRTGVASQYIGITKGVDKPIMVSRRELAKASELVGEEQFKAMIDVGVIPRGSKFAPGPGGYKGKDWSYIHPDTIKKYKGRHIAKQVATQIEPGIEFFEENYTELHGQFFLNRDLASLKKADLFAYNTLVNRGYAALGKVQAQTEREIKEFKANNVVIKGQGMPIDQWKELSRTQQAIARKDGFPAMIAKIEADNEKALKEYYLEYLGVGAPKYVPLKEYVKVYFAKKGWEHIDNPSKLSPKDWVAYQKKVTEAKKEHNATYTAPMALVTFVERYMGDKGYKPVDMYALAQIKGLITGDITAKDRAHIKEATDAYRQKYGTKAIVESTLGEVLGIFPPARAISPEVTLEDIKTEDWKIGGAIVGYLVGALTGGPVGIALMAGSSGLFIEDTVRNFDERSGGENAFSIAVDTLMVAGLLPRLKIPAKVKATETKAKRVIDKTIASEQPEGIAYTIGKQKMEEALKVIESLQKGVAKKISKAEATRLYREAGLSEVAIKQLLKPKILKLGEVAVKQFIDGLKTQSQHFVDTRAINAVRELSRFAPAKIADKISRAQAIKLYREAGLSESAIKQLTQPKLLRVSRKAVRQAIQDIKAGVERFATARTLKAMEQFAPPPATISKISRAEATRLYKSLGLSDAAVKEMVRPKLFRQSQRAAEALVKAIKAQSQHFVEARTVRLLNEIVRGLPTKPVAKISKAQAIKLYREAGLSEAVIKQLTQPRLLRVSRAFIDKVARNLKETISKGFNKLVEARAAEARAEAARLKPVVEPISKANARRLYREAGLPEATIKQLLKPKILKLGEAAVSKLARTLKADYNNLAQARALKAVRELEQFKVRPPGISRAQAAKLYREAGLSEATIKNLLRPKFLRVSEEAIRGVISRAKKAYRYNMDEIERAASDVLLKHGIKPSVLMPADEFTKALIVVTKQLPSGNLKLLKASIKRLELAAGRLPPKLKLLADTRVKLLKDKLATWIDISKKGKLTSKELEQNIRANKAFIDTADRALRRVKAPARREAIEKAVETAKKQLKTATREKAKTADIWPKWEEPLTGKLVPARVTPGKHPLAKVIREKALAKLKRSKKKVRTKAPPKSIPLRELATLTLSRLSATYAVRQEELVDAFSGMPLPERLTIAVVYPEIATRILPEPITRPTPEPTIKPAVAPEAMPKLITVPELEFAPAIKPAPIIKPIPKPEPKPAPKPEPKPAPKPEPVPEPPPVPKPVPVPLLPKPKTDKKKRERIKKSKGAIAWRHGELHGKDVFHVGLYPYTRQKDYLTVVGKKPEGATVVKGPGSARQSIKLLYGKSPPKTVKGDIGFFDFRITPTGPKLVDIDFVPDPKMQTTGDVRIGSPQPSITERPAGLGRSKSPRITPKTPRLRR